MAVVGGILTYICIYGFYLMGALSFFFAPNILTLGLLCFSVYLFTNRRKHEKELRAENQARIEELEDSFE